MVLGFNALQLSDDRYPLAPNREALQPGMVTLKSLADSDSLSPRLSQLVMDPPRIRASNPVARSALGYLSANCGGCHNDTGPLARLGLNLMHNVARARNLPEPGFLTAVSVPGHYPVPGVSTDGTLRLAPGSPERSAILYRMKSRRPFSQMPPLGTVLVDREAVELVRQWIEELPSSPVP